MREVNVITEVPRNMLKFNLKGNLRSPAVNLRLDKEATAPPSSCAHIILKRVTPSADRGLLVPAPEKPHMPIHRGLPVCPEDIR